ILGYRHRSDEAGRAFEQGVTLSPLYATAHQWYSYHLMVVPGRWDEAVREMARARELDPYSLVIAGSLVSAYDGAGRWADAEAMIEQSHALDANHPLTVSIADLFHDASHRHQDRIPADVRRAALVRAWSFDRIAGDSASAFDLERRLRDPGTRVAA